MKRFDEFLNEAFEWEDFDNTDLDGNEWDMKCEEFVEKFITILNKEMPKGTYQDKERNQALDAFKKLFCDQIEFARKKKSF